MTITGTSKYSVHVDNGGDYRAAYINISPEGEVSTTISLSDSVIMDVDANNRILGIELIGESAEFDIESVALSYGLDADALRLAVAEALA